MKALWWIVGALAVIALLFYAFNGYIRHQELGDTPMRTGAIDIIPIEHATAVIRFDETTLYTDPVGSAEAFDGLPLADIVLVTDLHQDHFSTSTLEAVVGSATLIVPQAVYDLLPEDLKMKAIALKNDESTTASDLEITAVPMYNLPESATAFHVKGRGNGYVIEREGTRVYVAGDTSGTAEMRALTDIDVALVPMNLPYTMSVDEAADAVLAFKPKQVYPYHYRGQDGLADIARFKELVNAGNPGIDVVLLNWYPG